MKQLHVLLFSLVFSISAFDLAFAQSGRGRPTSPQESANVADQITTIEGPVTGVISTNNMRGELRNYDVIIKVGDIRYDCRVDLNPPYSVFGRTISSERDLSFLYDKTVRASLRYRTIEDTIVSEDGLPDKTVKEGHGLLVKLVVLDSSSAIPSSQTPRLGNLTTGFVAVFSPDGRSIAVSRDRVIYLVNIYSGQERKLGESPTNTDFTALAFSPDGKSLASGGADFTVRLWTISTGRMKVLKKLFQGAGDRFGGHINALAFSPSGMNLAASTDSGENPIYLWTFPATVPEIIGTVSGAVELAFLDDSTLLAGGYAGHLIRFDLQTKQGRIVGSTSDGIGVFSISPDKKYVVSKGRYGTTLLWRLQTGEQKVLIPFSPRGTDCLGPMSFSPDGRTLMTGGYDICAWDFPSMTPRTLAHVGQINALMYSPNGALLLVRSNNQTVSLFSVK